MTTRPPLLTVARFGLFALLFALLAAMKFAQADLVGEPVATGLRVFGVVEAIAAAWVAHMAVRLMLVRRARR